MSIWRNPSEDLNIRHKNKRLLYSTEEVSQKFNKSYDSVRINILSDNIKFNKSLMKFIKCYEKFSEKQQVAGFQNFGMGSFI